MPSFICIYLTICIYVYIYTDSTTESLNHHSTKYLYIFIYIYICFSCHSSAKCKCSCSLVQLRPSCCADSHMWAAKLGSNRGVGMKISKSKHWNQRNCCHQSFSKTTKARSHHRHSRRGWAGPAKSAPVIRNI